MTYEPQWGTDVFGMYQSMVEGRAVPWDLLVKDVPEKHHDLDYIVSMLDWEATSTRVQAAPLFQPKRSPAGDTRDGLLGQVGRLRHGPH